MKPNPLWILTAAPLLLLAADSGPQQHDLTIHLPDVRAVQSQFLNRTLPYQITRVTTGRDIEHSLLLDQSNGRTWLLTSLSNNIRWVPLDLYSGEILVYTPAESSKVTDDLTKRSIQQAMEKLEK